MAAFVHVIQGNRDGARARLGTLPATLRAQLELEPDNTQVLRSLASLEGLILGRRDEALRYIERAAELVPEAKNAFIGVSVSEIRAHIHAWTGDKDRAIAEYARLLRIPSGLNVHEMRSDLRYTPLRGDPRFEALLNDPKNNAPLY